MSFAKDVDKFMEEVEEIHKENIIKVEDYTFNQIRSKSPVDTGAFKANHNRTVGRPNTSYSLSTTSSSNPPAVPSGSFFDMYIANGVPYGKYLETGSSQQAPSGVYMLAYRSAKARYGI